MSLRGLLRGWWIVLLAVVLAVGASFAYSLNAPDRYQSRGTYVIGPAAGLTQPEVIVRSFDSLQGQGIVPTLVELLSSQSIAAEVGEGIGLDSRELEDYSIQASVLSSSNTLELAVLGPDRQATAALARGVGTRASAVFEDLYSVYQIRELDEPQVAEDRYSPQPLRNAVLAVLLGLTAGGAIAALRARDTGSEAGADARVDLVPTPLPAAAPTASTGPGSPRPPADVPPTPGPSPAVASSTPEGPSRPEAPAGRSPRAADVGGDRRTADAVDRSPQAPERRTRAERRRRGWWGRGRRKTPLSPGQAAPVASRTTPPGPKATEPPARPTATEPAPARPTATEPAPARPTATEPAAPLPTAAEPTAPERTEAASPATAEPVGATSTRHDGGSTTGWPTSPRTEVTTERSDEGGQ